MTQTKRRGSRVKKSAKKGRRAMKPERAPVGIPMPSPPEPELEPEAMPLIPPDAPPFAIKAIEKWLQDVPAATVLPFSDHLKLLTEVVHAIRQGQAGGRWFKQSEGILIVHRQHSIK